MIKIAINGFGRIGRLVFRAIVEEGIASGDLEHRVLALGGHRVGG